MVSGVYRSTGTRPINGDTVALEQVRTEAGESCLLAVCDGIGSRAHGEIVSGYTAECLVKWFYGSGLYMGHAARGRIIKSINKCIYDCHMELREKADAAGISWGCACTCVCVWGLRYICVHIGDSAAYVIGRTSRRITDVHRNARGELIRCVGSMGYYKPDISFGHLRRGQGMVVASDGFTERFSDAELTDMLHITGEITSERIEKRLSSIGSEASRRGGCDDKSAVMIMV